MSTPLIKTGQPTLYSVVCVGVMTDGPMSGVPSGSFRLLAFEGSRSESAPYATTKAYKAYYT